MEGEERPGNANFTGIEWEQKNWHVQICKKEEKKNACFRLSLLLFLISTKRYLFDESSIEICILNELRIAFDYKVFH